MTWQGGSVENCSCAGLPWWEIYFGTEPDPPSVRWLSDQPLVYDPGPLLPSTTYYWRVVNGFCTGGTSSPVRSFTTQDPDAVQPETWSAFKQLFR